MRTFGRNVLGELCQEIKRREDLKIPIRARFEVVVPGGQKHGLVDAKIAICAGLRP